MDCAAEIIPVEPEADNAAVGNISILYNQQVDNSCIQLQSAFAANSCNSPTHMKRQLCNTDVPLL